MGAVGAQAGTAAEKIGNLADSVNGQAGPLVGDLRGVVPQLVRALKAEIGLPVHVHCHYIGGMAPMNYIKAAEAGADIVDTAVAAKFNTLVAAQRAAKQEATERGERGARAVGIGGRRMPGTVHLESIRCNGSAHDGCEAGCLIFWKEAWLKRIESAPAKTGGTTVQGAQPSRAGCTEDVLHSSIRIAPVAGQTEPTYVCQNTQVKFATQPSTLVNRRMATK